MITRNIVMQLWCLQIEFNNIFNAGNRLFSVCFEYIYKKKIHVSRLFGQELLIRKYDFFFF